MHIYNNKRLLLYITSILLLYIIYMNIKDKRQKIKDKRRHQKVLRTTYYRMYYGLARWSLPTILFVKEVYIYYMSI